MNHLMNKHIFSQYLEKILLVENLKNINLIQE